MFCVFVCILCMRGLTSSLAALLRWWAWHGVRLHIAIVRYIALCVVGAFIDFTTKRS